MELNKKILKSLIIIALCFVLDRISKVYILEVFLQNGFKNIYINSFLNITLLWNNGIAFGLFESENIVYHFITLVIFSIITFIFYLIYKTNIKLEFVCFSVIAGGAIGNLFDRLYYQAVPDFIDFHYNDFHWFTFNVSDVFITIGIILLLIFDMFKFNKKDKDNEKNN